MKVGPGTADFLLLFAGIVLPGAVSAGGINIRLNKSMGWDQKELNTFFVQFFTFFWVQLTQKLLLQVINLCAQLWPCTFLFNGKLLFIERSLTEAVELLAVCFTKQTKWRTKIIWIQILLSPNCALALLLFMGSTKNLHYGLLDLLSSSSILQKFGTLA